MSLSHNKITKDGIVHIADKLKSLQAPQAEDRPRLHTFSLKSNELNDFCIDALRDIISSCPELKIVDISENLFLASVQELIQLHISYQVVFKE